LEWPSQAGADRTLILIQHAGIPRAALRCTLQRRWPQVALHDPAHTEPNSWLNVADAADLARRRRGIEPLRIVVMPQRASSGGRAETIPFAF
jgi:hypothetical protein